MDHRGVLRKDRDREKLRKREMIAGSEWLMTDCIGCFLDGAVAPLSGEMFNCWYFFLNYKKFSEYTEWVKKNHKNLI